LAVVAAAAVGPFVHGIQAMGKPVVKIMDAAGQIVAPVAVDTTGCPLVALLAPIGLEQRSVAVLVAPLVRMDIGQGEVAAMT
jgi:hypothetical protein